MVTRSKSTASAASSEREDEGQDTTDVELDGHKLYLCSNKGCGISWGTADELSEHLMVCDNTRDSVTLSCVHCGRTFRQVPNLIDHLRNMHGPKRFTCGVCTDEFRVSCLANMYRHFKTKHKTVATILKPMDPFKNNQDTDKFIVQLKQASPVKSSPKKVSRLNTFSPSEIEQLPKQPIFQTHVQCSECNFSDRVRSNVIRHLKSHMEDKEITRAAPINPMPCLDSRERHFDKMTNWAGSSHRNPDGSLKPPPKRRSGIDLSTGELEKLPRFIPTSRRYVCGAESCEYLTTDLDMLTLHVKNLHAQEAVYTCPHCTDAEPFSGQGTVFERGLAHLRLHGDRLYRCSICQYHHYTRKVVEKHLEEKHDEYPESVLIIREPDTPEFESSPIVKHTWLCSECGYTCHSNDDIKNHCKTEHNIKSQYRCSLCNLRSSGVTTVEQHFSNKHPGENVFMYASYYRSDMSDNKILIGVPTVETRGELINPVPIKPNPAPAAPVEKIKLIRQILVEEVETPLPNSTVVAPAPMTYAEKRRSSKEGAEADLIQKFGSLGNPIGSLYSCPVCKRFQSKFKHCLRDHLFREYRYKKYKCKSCSMSTTIRSNLNKHLQQSHGVEKDFVKHIINNKSNPQLEAWVNRVLTHQSSSMFDIPDDSSEASPPKAAVKAKSSPAKVAATTPIKLTRATASSPPKQQQQQSLLKSPSLRQSTRSLLKPQVQPVTPEKAAPAVKNIVETTTIDLDDDDEDRPLVIEEDSDGDTGKGISTKRYSSDLLMKESTSDTIAQKGKKGNKGKFECKHCHRSFKVTHGLKMHIKLYHYGLGMWQCGYCPATMTSEHVTLLHCHAAHPELPEKAIKNTKKGIVLDDEFWEREYGIVKGVSTTAESTDELPENYNKKCQHCNYRTNLSATLKLHEMRHWVQKPFGCGYCKFQGVSEYNMKKHCAKAHPDFPVRVITNSLPSTPQIKPLKRTKRRNKGETAAKTAKVADEDTDLEILDQVEEGSSEVDKNQTKNDPTTTAPAEPAMLYRCFYCPLKSLKLLDIHQHWLSKHKNNPVDNMEAHFRYKSTPISEVLQTKDPGVSKKCTYCNFKAPINILKSHHLTLHPGKDFQIVNQKNSSFKCSHCIYAAFTVNALKLHMETEHPKEEQFDIELQKKPAPTANLGTLSQTSPVSSSSKYLCLWCNEICENRQKIDLHNKCFHSHLEPKFEAVPPTATEKSLDPPPSIATPEVPKLTATLPSIAINPNRRLYLCPDCPHKTMTLRVMRAHVSKNHVKEHECPQCGIVLADKKAAVMHVFVEHPKLDRGKTLMPKCKEKVDHKMLFVKREGDDEKNEFCEVNITDILSKQTSPVNECPPFPESSSTNSLLQPEPRYSSKNSLMESELMCEPTLDEFANASPLTSPPLKRRFVAKKSTSKPPKNTARKSFLSSSGSPSLMIECEESSEYDSESDDEGQSIYVHPSERETIQPLSTMPHLSTELNVGNSNPITVTVDKLALLMNLEPKVKVSDLKN